jgi:glycosyltransferase involved in cell wall biosynthesis
MKASNPAKTDKSTGFATLANQSIVKKAVSFLVNGGSESAMGIRARSFQALLTTHQIQVSYREGNKLVAAWRFFVDLLKGRPETIYVFDMAVSGVLAGSAYSLLTRCRLVIDTGDAIGFLADSTGDRGWLARKLTHFLEYASLKAADVVVVRSHFHREYLGRQAREVFVVPDGVDVKQFGEDRGGGLRERFGLQDCVTVGLLGSITWNPRWEICYGWDLVESLAQLRDLPIKGVVIGDGNGLERLKAMARKLGVQDRIIFVGRVPYEDLPGYLGLMDICLSTQTNDLAGQVRTTGKLPLYLATGKHVLATAVGEAARVLPPSMLLPYEGTKDETYPVRLAERLRELVLSDEWRRSIQQSKSVAREKFDYKSLQLTVRAALSK